MESLVMDRRLLLQSLAAGAALGAEPAFAQPSRPRRKARAFVTTADGAQLAIRDWGEGPPVLLVHSWALNSEMWGQQVLALTDAGFRCIAYDRRGHGASSDPGRGYDADTLAGDLSAV